MKFQARGWGIATIRDERMRSLPGDGLGRTVFKEAAFVAGGVGAGLPRAWSLGIEWLCPLRWRQTEIVERSPQRKQPLTITEADQGDGCCIAWGITAGLQRAPQGPPGWLLLATPSCAKGPQAGPSLA